MYTHKQDVSIAESAHTGCVVRIQSLEVFSELLCSPVPLHHKQENLRVGRVKVHAGRELNVSLKLLVLCVRTIKLIITSY